MKAFNSIRSKPSWATYLTLATTVSLLIILLFSCQIAVHGEEEVTVPIDKVAKINKLSAEQMTKEEVTVPRSWVKSEYFEESESRKREDVSGTEFNQSGDVITVGKENSSDHETIKEAIKSAGDGDTIKIQPGSYEVGLVIEKSVSIQGVKEEGARPELSPTSGAGSAIKLKSDGVKISRLLIKGSNDSDRADGIKVLSNENLIEDNVIQNLAHGIRVKNSNDNLIKGNHTSENREAGILLKPDSNNNTIKNNELYDNQTLGGVFIWERSNNNLVSDNTVKGNRHSIKMMYCSGNEIINNLAKENELHGVYMLHADGNLVKNNEVINNPHSGIIVKNSSGNRIIGNLVRGNNLIGGIKVNNDDFESGWLTKNTLIKENRIIENEGWGIFFRRNRAPTIKGNIIERNEGGAIVLNEVSGNTKINRNSISKNEAGIVFSYKGLIQEARLQITYNNILENEKEGLIQAPQDFLEVDATHNWWGDPSGPKYTDNPESNGEEIHPPEPMYQFKPWLEEPVGVEI